MTFHFMLNEFATETVLPTNEKLIKVNLTTVMINEQTDK